MFRMGGLGPMFGQVGFFNKFGGMDFEDKRPRDRYAQESARLLGALDRHMQGHDWMLGTGYTIADTAIFPWVRNLVGLYAARELARLERFPKVQRGFLIPSAG